jgi:hypothetical protein
VIGWLGVKSSSPEVSNTGWDFVVFVSVSNTSDGGLHPVSELSVVDWFSSEDALDDLVKPLVSCDRWFSSNYLDEVVGHGGEWSSSSSEGSISPSNGSSFSVNSVPSDHVFPGESIS